MRSLPTAVLAILAALQMGLFALTGAPKTRTAGLILGALTVALILLPGLARRFRATALSLLTGAIVINLAFHVALVALPFPYRLLQAAVTLGYGGVVLAAAMVPVFRTPIADALLLSLSTAFLLFCCEVALQQIPLFAMVNAVTWIGGEMAHPVVGAYSPPDTVAKTIYPDNPRRYFEESDPARSQWHLEDHDPGSSSRLAFPGAHDSAIRVEISRAATPVVWHIQLTEPGLALSEKAAYEVTFRARSDAPRTIVYGVTQAHAPWQSMGLYKEIDLDATWRQFKQTFTPASSDTAQLHFDMGGAALAVELADVVVRRLADGRVVEALVPKQYFVKYNFNHLGCRGPDYAIPRRPNTRRIVVLGDSFTVGVGVHERDTFEAQLEALLNEHRGASGTEFEVINCGVSGDSPHEERLLYELIASQYSPDLVLVEMAWNRDRSFRDEARRGYLYSQGRAEFLLLSWHAIQLLRYEGRHPHDFRPSVNELLKLQEDCRAQHARLAVAFFRYESLSNRWKNLITTVSKGLEGKGIPTIDLGTGMLRDHAAKELQVHKYDPHPNNIAHGIAAHELEDFLRREHLLD